MSLFLLQNCDEKVESFQKQISQTEHAIQDDSERIQFLKIITEIKSEASRLNDQLSTLEKKIDTTRIKMQQSSSNLYGGRIHNPKELQDLEVEIGLLKNALSQLEDQQFNMMIQIDEQTKLLQDQEALLKQHLSNKEIADQGLSAEIKSYRHELENLLTERTALVSGIDQVSLQKYQQLRATKGGIAVTRVDDNTCEKCGAEITQAVWQKARISSELCYCDTCGRIIYAR